MCVCVCVSMVYICMYLCPLRALRVTSPGQVSRQREHGVLVLVLDFGNIARQDDGICYARYPSIVCVKKTS